MRTSCSLLNAWVHRWNSLVLQPLLFRFTLKVNKHYTAFQTPVRSSKSKVNPPNACQEKNPQSRTVYKIKVQNTYMPLAFAPRLDQVFFRKAAYACATTVGSSAMYEQLEFWIFRQTTTKSRSKYTNTVLWPRTVLIKSHQEIRKIFPSITTSKMYHNTQNPNIHTQHELIIRGKRRKLISKWL